MINRSFHWVETRVTAGWLPDGSPGFDPGQPIHVAHDTLEHFSPNTNFRYELLAFGATVFGRMYGNAEQKITSAEDLAGFLIQQKFKVPSTGPSMKKPLKDKKAEKLLNTFVGMAANETILRTGFCVSPEVIRKAVINSMGWMRIGYRLAKRRWHGDHQLADDTFQKIFYRVLADYKAHTPHPGDSLVIKANEKNGRVWFLHPSLKGK